MNAQPLRWSDLELLVAVRTAGSLLRAGRRLGLAASTVGRRLASLERAAGTPILERSPHGIRLTPAGEALAACGADIELAVGRALRELPKPGSSLTGTIRVSAGDGFAAPIVAAVRAMVTQHPGVRCELSLEDRPVDLARREADVAIRTVHQGESSLVYRKLGTLPYGVFGHARYLADRGQPKRLDDLSRHAWVGLAPPLDRLSSQRWMHARTGHAAVLASNTFGGLLAAVREGLGLAAIPVASAADLVQVLRQSEVPGLPVWLVAHRDARAQPHVAAFLELLKTELITRLSKVD